MKLNTMFAASALVAGIAMTGHASANGGLYGVAEIAWADAGAEVTVPGQTFSEESLAISGVGGNVRLGYEFLLPGGYVGFEGSIGESSAEYTWADSTDAVSITRGLNYGIATTLGTNINRSTSLYGTLGYHMTDFEFSGRVTGLGSETTSETYGGPRVGLGVKSDITSQLALRLEWTRTFYGSKTVSFDEVNLGESEFDIQENEVTIGIHARF